MSDRKSVDMSLPMEPKVYHPDTGETEALPGMGTYIGCPFCGQRLQW